MQDIKFSYAPNTFISGRDTELSLENRRLTRELASVQSFRKNQTATIEGYQRKTRELQSGLAYARRLNKELWWIVGFLSALVLIAYSGPDWQERYHLAEHGHRSVLEENKKLAAEAKALLGTRVVRRG